MILAASQKASAALCSATRKVSRHYSGAIMNNSSRFINSIGTSFCNNCVQSDIMIRHSSSTVTKSPYAHKKNAQVRYSSSLGSSSVVSNDDDEILKAPSSASSTLSPSSSSISSTSSSQTSSSSPATSFSDVPGATLSSGEKYVLVYTCKVSIKL